MIQSIVVTRENFHVITTNLLLLVIRALHRGGVTLSSGLQAGMARIQVSHPRTLAWREGKEENTYT